MLASNLLPILFAGIVSAVIGFLWYHPRAFGALWMRLSGLTPETVEQGKRRMNVDALLALLASLLAAYVISSLEQKLGIYDVAEATRLAVLLWAGFVVPALSGTVLWEQKPIALYCINAGYWLVSIITMSMILIV